MEGLKIIRNTVEDHLGSEWAIRMRLSAPEGGGAEVLDNTIINANRGIGLYAGRDDAVAGNTFSNVNQHYYSYDMFPPDGIEILDSTPTAITVRATGGYPGDYHFQAKEYCNGNATIIDSILLSGDTWVLDTTPGCMYAFRAQKTVQNQEGPYTPWHFPHRG